MSQRSRHQSPGHTPPGDRAMTADASWAQLVEEDLGGLDAPDHSRPWADVQELLTADTEGLIDPEELIDRDELNGPWGHVPGVDHSGFADMLPGAALAEALEAFPPSQLGVHELADAVAAWEKIIAWAAAKQAEAAAELTRRPELRPDDDAGRFASLHPVAVTASALCAVWPWTKPQAEKLVAQAVSLVEDHPAVHQALAEGRLNARQAQILSTALGKCDASTADLIKKAVLPFVHTWTDVKLSRVVNELLHELDAAGAKRRRREARQRRDVWTEPDEDGMAWLVAYLPAEEAAAVMTALNAAADADKGDPCRDSRTCTCRDHDPDPDPENASADPSRESRAGAGSGGRCGARTKAQRRADALASFGWSSLATGRLGGQRGCSACGTPAGTKLAQAHGRPVTVNVTVPMSTLLGLDEHPGYLDGYGPIDADVARSLAAAGVWRWVGTAPAGGQAIDYGTTRYVPPQDLVDFVLLRDRECVMPGCHRPAYRCEIDHRAPWPYGPTSACNCSALCKACHVHKHRAGWKVEHLGGGRQRWTSPTGHSSVVEFPRIAPDTPPAGAAATARGHSPPEQSGQSEPGRDDPPPF
ncbi:HNH endonuclease signature motif containing protein [Phytoactinopolyspora mesophila]|uniref:DUF222 domain-containing protein n=1 Tax=Phytoactinopolyspora mesophila TaxID=2650750 RepID=A0A7K3MAN6_9ACTN|nr:HNH endonuclease signature motif containing protein [Phytoactinopolyspora mesophila]NDL60369.1 DUF222 domain-containing protein [Phytoactinopolyspora mesophila]